MNKNKEEKTTIAKLTSLIKVLTGIIAALAALIGATMGVLDLVGKHKTSPPPAAVAEKNDATANKEGAVNQNFVNTGVIQNSKITQTQTSGGGKR